MVTIRALSWGCKGGGLSWLEQSAFYMTTGHVAPLPLSSPIFAGPNHVLACRLPPADKQQPPLGVIFLLQGNCGVQVGPQATFWPVHLTCATWCGPVVKPVGSDCPNCKLWQQWWGMCLCGVGSFQYVIDDKGWAPVGGAPQPSGNSTGVSNGTSVGATNATSLGVIFAGAPPLITSNVSAQFLFDVVAFGSTSRSANASLLAVGVTVEARVDGAATWVVRRLGEPLYLTGLKDGLHLVEARARWVDDSCAVNVGEEGESR